MDILATTADDRLVAIETRYRSIDHDHVTRGLAYAVGLEASALLIIAGSHAEEFVDRCRLPQLVLGGPGDDGIAVFLVSLSLEALGELHVPASKLQLGRTLGGHPIAGRGKANPTATPVAGGRMLNVGSGLTSWRIAGMQEPGPLARKTESREGGYLVAQAVPGVNTEVG